MMGISVGRIIAAACVVLAGLLNLGEAVAQPAAPAVPAPAAAPEYQLGAGDVIHVNVYQNPDLTLDTRITEAGVISYPLLGSVRVGGLTVTAAEKLIADGLKNGNFIKQPQVNIVVTQIRGNQVSVLGQVNRPGRYPIELADIRLSDMLAMAGGIAASGTDLVILVGTRGGQPYRLEVDLPTLFAAAGRGNDVLVRNGDTIWVDRQPLVYIYGEVQRPGPMRLERGMTLMQALAAGGGLTARGTERGIRVHRKNTSGAIDVVTPGMDEKMRDGDVIYVRESLL